MVAQDDTLKKESEADQEVIVAQDDTLNGTKKDCVKFNQSYWRSSTSVAPWPPSFCGASAMVATWGWRLEEFADAAAEDAGAVAVDDADAGKAGEEGAVEILLQLFGGFVDGAADEVDLHAHVVGVGAGDGDVDVLLLAGGG